MAGSSGAGASPVREPMMGSLPSHGPEPEHREGSYSDDVEVLRDQVSSLKEEVEAL